MKDFGITASNCKGEWLIFTTKVLGKNYPLPSVMAWIPKQQLGPGTLFPSAGYLEALTFPLGLMKSKAGGTLSKLAIFLSPLPGKLWSCLSFIIVLSLWKKRMGTQC